VLGAAIDEVGLAVALHHCVVFAATTEHAVPSIPGTELVPAVADEAVPASESADGTVVGKSVYDVALVGALDRVRVIGAGET
jgi:hypothetical protein